MNRWGKFWMNKWVWYPSLTFGPLLFYVGIRLLGTAAMPLMGVILSSLIAFIGLALIWFPFTRFKGEYERIMGENERLDAALFRSNSRGDRVRGDHNNAWIDDDDIDGDGVGGDSLSRMGITDRFQ